MKIKSKQGIPLAMVHMNPLIVSWLLLLIEWFYLGTIERYYFLLAILAFLLSNEIMDDVDLQSTEKLFWEKYVFNVVVQSIPSPKFKLILHEFCRVLRLGRYDHQLKMYHHFCPVH